MGIFDAILEGIGNVLLLIVGFFLFILGALMYNDNNILGFIFIIVGLGMIVAKYKRQ